MIPSIIASSTPRSASSIIPPLRRFFNNKNTHQQYKILCYIPHRSYQCNYRYQRGIHDRMRLSGNKCDYIQSSRSSIHRHIVQSFSSKSDVIDIQSQTITEHTSSLSELIKETYSIGETDGVVDTLKSNDILTKLSADLDTEEVAIQLVNAAIEASDNNRGRLAAIINSILGSCCGSENDKAHPQVALDVLDVVDEMNTNDKTAMITPDIVSLALVYYAISSDTEEYESQSQYILERTQRNAKKMGGSKLRKALAAERRSKTNNGKDTEQQLQSLIGNDLRILQETDEYIVIGKPSGTVCYHNKKTSAGKITNSRKKKKTRDNNTSGEAKRIDISLVDALTDSSVSLSTLNPIARGIVHRIDRGTSGSIILAKTDEMHLRLVALFFLRQVKKKYLALVPAYNRRSGESDTLAMGSTGVIDISVDGRPAHSTYKVIKQYGESSSDAQAALLLEVNTSTGRKHQVRSHCAEGLDRPIFLDPLYYSTTDGNKSKPIDKKKRNDTYKVNIAAEDNRVLPKAISDLLDNANMKEQFFLHAASLSIDELDLSIEAPLPQWWTDTVKQLD